MLKSEADTTHETQSSTGASSVTSSVGDRTSRSSRASRTNLIAEGDVPALPSDAWKRRSVKRSSYDFKHMSVGLSNDEAAVLAHDAKRHSTTMTPTTSIATSPMLVDSPKTQPLPPPALNRSLKGVKRMKSHARMWQEQTDLHADLHWEISAGNPRNWSTRKRRMHTFIPCAAAFICTLSSTILTPAQALATENEISNHEAVLPTSLYLLGLAFGPSISNVGTQALGRKYTYIISLSLFAVFLLAGGLARNLAGLVVCRFFAGISCSPVLQLGIGLSLDIRTGCHRASTLVLYYSIILIGSTLGPVIGGYVAAMAGISWTQYVILFAVIILLVAIICMHETAKITIDRQKDGLHRLAPLSRNEVNSALLAPFNVLQGDLILWATSIYVAYNIGVLYSIYTALPAVLATAFTFSPGGQGLTFLSMTLGAILATVIVFVFHRWCYKPQVENFKDKKATEDERTVRTGRRASKALSVKASRDSMRSSTHTRGGRRSSFVRSLKGLSSSGAKPAAQAQDDYQRNAIMARAAAIYLNSVRGNIDKPVSIERILCILDQHIEFGHFCAVLESLQLQYDRVDLAKVLVEALATNAAPSTNMSMYTWNNNSSVNEVEQHRKATAEALEAVPASQPRPPTANTVLSQRRKTFIPAVNAAPPEWRLWLAMPVSLLIVASLFILGWTINGRIHWMTPVTAMTLFAFGLLVALVSTIQYLLDCYDSDDVLSVLGLHTMLILLSGFAFSLFAQDVLRLGAGPGLSLYACLGIVFESIPIFLYFYGPKLRQRQSIKGQYNTRR
ncbi:Putative major facilitator superfamily, MFS transporter superfamily [Septoria linicola]|uniref:Major facilitator superfamily, MFS transporter superfamily n=1 Tax=Septoria linicola TaxID=215465 RepID=A0A9Q9AZ78_9PEZI|nr:Putative major facilitator superfamily, MFS transporter superfamily [Septoria linicola]